MNIARATVNLWCPCSTSRREAAKTRLLEPTDGVAHALRSSFAAALRPATLELLEVGWRVLLELLLRHEPLRAIVQAWPVTGMDADAAARAVAADGSIVRLMNRGDLFTIVNGRRFQLKDLGGAV